MSSSATKTSLDHLVRLMIGDDYDGNGLRRQYSSIEGPVMMVSTATQKGDRFYICGDIHSKEAGSCNDADESEPSIHIADLILKAGLSAANEGRFVDVFFESWFPGHGRTPTGESHWKKTEAYVASRVEDAIRGALLHNKPEEMRGLKIPRGVRAHYVDVRFTDADKKSSSTSLLIADWLVDLERKKTKPKTQKSAFLYAFSNPINLIRFFEKSIEDPIKDALEGRRPKTYEEVTPDIDYENLINIETDSAIILPVERVLEGRKFLRKLVDLDYTSSLSSSTAKRIPFVPKRIRFLIANQIGSTGFPPRSVEMDSILGWVSEFKSMFIDTIPTDIKIDSDITEENIRRVQECVGAIDLFAVDVYTVGRIMARIHHNRERLNLPFSEIWYYGGAEHATNVVRFIEAFLPKSANEGFVYKTADGYENVCGNDVYDNHIFSRLKDSQSAERVNCVSPEPERCLNIKRAEKTRKVSKY